VAEFNRRSGNKNLANDGSRRRGRKVRERMSDSRLAKGAASGAGADVRRQDWNWLSRRLLSRRLSGFWRTGPHPLDEVCMALYTRENDKFTRSSRMFWHKSSMRVLIRGAMNVRHNDEAPPRELANPLAVDRHET
jgi:hypothetical protein